MKKKALKRKIEDLEDQIFRMSLRMDELETRIEELTLSDEDAIEIPLLYGVPDRSEN